jgi:hypothetical protein
VEVFTRTADVLSPAVVFSGNQDVSPTLGGLHFPAKRLFTD